MNPGTDALQNSVGRCQMWGTFFGRRVVFHRLDLTVFDPFTLLVEPLGSGWKCRFVVGAQGDRPSRESLSWP